MVNYINIGGETPIIHDYTMVFYINIYMLVPIRAKPPCAYRHHYTSMVPHTRMVIFWHRTCIVTKKKWCIYSRKIESWHLTPNFCKKCTCYFCKGLYSLLADNQRGKLGKYIIICWHCPRIKFIISVQFSILQHFEKFLTRLDCITRWTLAFGF